MRLSTRRGPTDFADVQGWVALTKNSVELLKSAATLLPTGTKRAEIESRIKAAEQALNWSDAKLAHELGLKLCDCIFPQIMLWKEPEQSRVCPNPACGRKKSAACTSQRKRWSCLPDRGHMAGWRDNRKYTGLSGGLTAF